MPYAIFFTLAAITWLFSSRRDLFIRLFATSEDDPHIDAMPKEDDFRRSLRIIAVLQLLVGVALMFTKLFWPN